ncbi:TetR/AcrR family transcriptional regulator [Alteromonas alba]|uniref:TetR/AcrR family transcriptional regulator n=1 Tax=Alteromonas alba TaxID=2079529 RepID=A0A2S9VC31_9ALTE|nr:TetR/AcrR family transcriptional regulator [Alteromonas alba]PRO74003.1 TetR/AcrR family transcriptional regulator [Alteromonas alba]HCB09079.1 TetR/AcrR family transcriptional regulator [Alteromonas sp.]|tara:strand:+ start:1658 stop:2239 length:582 start_codon:yes stop_codon:yes gene_type:complete
MSRVSARDKLLKAAGELFYDHGITATGVDAVITRAGVAKMSLYNNFKSKSELIAAYIDARHQEWLDLFARRSDNLSNGWERVLAVFDAYQDHAEFDYQNGFRGCGLLNAAAEMPAGSQEREAVNRHKQEVREIVINQLNELPLTEESGNTAASLAEHICFLLEGSISLAGLSRDVHAISRARAMADKLIERAL